MRRPTWHGVIGLLSALVGASPVHAACTEKSSVRHLSLIEREVNGLG